MIRRRKRRRVDAQIRVLQLTNLYPSPSAPVFGVFVKEQVESIDACPLAGKVEQIVKVIQGRRDGPKAYMEAVLALRDLVRTKQIDLVHAHHLLSGAIVGLALLDIPAVVSFMNQPGHQLPGWPSLVEAGLFRFVIHRSQCQIFKTPVPNVLPRSPNATFLPNGVDLNFFKPVPRRRAREQLGLPRDEFVLLFVSANSLDRPAKRRDRFIELCKILENHYGAPVYRLEASEESRSAMKLMYSAADFHVLTSDHEGSPNSAKEALACDCRVVATPVGSLPQLLSDVEGCAISSELDANALAAAIIRLRQSPRPDGRTALVRKGLDQESVAVKLIEIYTSLAGASTEQDQDRHDLRG